MTSKFLKGVVEEEFEIDDLAENKSRLENYLYPRYVYYALCRAFTGESLTGVAKTIGQDHSTAIHALKRFDEYKGQSFFCRYYKGFKNIYDAVKGHVSHIEVKKENIHVAAIREMQTEYDDKYLELLRRSHAIITSMRRRNKMLSSEVFQEVADLPEEDFREFEGLAKTFLKRKYVQTHEQKPEQ